MRFDFHEIAVHVDDVLAVLSMLMAFAVAIAVHNPQNVQNIHHIVAAVADVVVVVVQWVQ